MQTMSRGGQDEPILRSAMRPLAPCHRTVWAARLQRAVPVERYACGDGRSNTSLVFNVLPAIPVPNHRVNVCNKIEPILCIVAGKKLRVRDGAVPLPQARNVPVTFDARGKQNSTGGERMAHRPNHCCAAKQDRLRRKLPPSRREAGFRSSFGTASRREKQWKQGCSARVLIYASRFRCTVSPSWPVGAR